MGAELTPHPGAARAEERRTMPLWAGIDEAGYGPKLGPLVVGAAAFELRVKPKEGLLWNALSDAVTRRFSRADGRVMVDDSKAVYSRSRGIRPLEEGVLSFLRCLGHKPVRAEQLLSAVLHPDCAMTDGAPWSEDVGSVRLPLESNASALASKAALLAAAMPAAEARFVDARLAVVLPTEYNRMVDLTRNKSFLLFQKCGLLLQRLWRMAEGQDAYVLVDRHGGRIRYRRLLRDVFPHFACDVEREGADGSVYRLSDGGQTMWLAFKEKGDRKALPTALASMFAKYVRELYMHAFNEYWRQRLDGLKPTAGYWTDAGRFLKDIAPALESEGTDLSAMVRCS
jgi:hypothetical protein